MDKAIINIIYTDSLESILVKGEEMEDISSIQDIPIPEWFSELDDRSGWGGLIEEIHKMLGDENVDLSFDFSGPYESSCIFKQCLKEHGFGEDALSPEEITKNNIEDAEKAEHRGFYKEALKHYTNAAEFGNSAEAQYKVAQYYYYDDINKRLDISFDEDVVNKAIDYYEQAAEQGYTKAGYRLFEIFSSGEKGVREDWTEAFKWLNEYSDQEDSEVQDNLGDCYYNGNGVEQNYEEAVKWYKKAAEQGNSYAQYSLGACYYNGYGTEKDYEKAVKWFRTAAEQDNSEAQCNLGDCYYYGDGIEQNYEEAVKWFRIAAEQGNSEAQYKLGLCYYNGYGTEKDYKEAVNWYKKVAEQGDSEAQYKLGICYYYYGYGIEKDYKEAVKWFRKAAEQGNSGAQYNLGVCYENGNGVEKNIETAFAWYKKAADNPLASKDACFKLAETYYGQIDSNGNVRSGGIIAASVLIPVTNWFTIPAALVGSAILKRKKYKAFLKTDAGKDMLQYYRKAAGLGHEKAQDRVKKLEKYL